MLCRRQNFKSEPALKHIRCSFVFGIWVVVVFENGSINEMHFNVIGWCAMQEAKLHISRPALTNMKFSFVVSLLALLFPNGFQQI